MTNGYSCELSWATTKVNINRDTTKGKDLFFHMDVLVVAGPILIQRVICLEVFEVLQIFFCVTLRLKEGQLEFRLNFFTILFRLSSVH